VAQEPRTAQERALELLRATLATASWLPTATNMTKIQRLVWGIRGAIVLGLVLLIASAVDKTLWDYLELLIVPAALALGVFWLNRRQDIRDQQAQEERSRSESAAQAAQVERALEVENERAQDAALQAYLDRLTQLLVTHRGEDLIRTRVDDEVRQVIQARSEPLLRNLTSTRRWSLVLFLAVMGLLARDRPIISLAGADLRGVGGYGAPLGSVDLSRANLSEANLSEANLSDADLSDANLSNASLTEAALGRARGVTEEQLEEQTDLLHDAIMPDESKHP
jgi:uncharacterized protein YjbI with pentapeptide repeats